MRDTFECPHNDADYERNDSIEIRMKLKRRQVAKRYAPELKKLYEERDGLETVMLEERGEGIGETAALQDVLKSKL